MLVLLVLLGGLGLWVRWVPFLTGGFARRGWRGADGEREVRVVDEVGGLRDGVGFSFLRMILGISSCLLLDLEVVLFLRLMGLRYRCSGSLVIKRNAYALESAKNSLRYHWTKKIILKEGH